MSTEIADSLTTYLNVSIDDYLQQEIDSVSTISLDELIQQHGQENVANAFSNSMTEQTGEALKTKISESDLPQSIKDDAIIAIDQGVQDRLKPTTDEAQDAVNEIFLTAIINAASDAADEAEAAANDQTTGTATTGTDGSGAVADSSGAGAANDSETVESSESTTMEAPPVGTGSTGSATQGNWLVILASVMSEAAAKHLQAAIGHATTIGEIGGEGDTRSPEEQAAATVSEQGLMQAETQLFKMVFEAASTLIKTVGESFSTMSRKQ